MVAREHSIKVPGQQRVEGSVEDETKEGEESGRHVELEGGGEREREREREREHSSNKYSICTVSKDTVPGSVQLLLYIYTKRG